jgi:endoglucanase
MISIRSKVLWVNPDSMAAKAAVELKAAGKKEVAFIYGELAKIPTTIWLTGSGKGSTVDAALIKAGTQLVTFAVYNEPLRDGSADAYSAGGAADLAAYKVYTDDIASGIKGRLCIIFLAPDALAMYDRLSTERKAERLACLNYAIDKYTAAGALVYLDVGDSGWTGPRIDSFVPLAVQAGVLRCRGIVSNVAHFRAAADEHAWCLDFVTRIKAGHGVDLRYMIDVSRNGAGPYKPLPGQSSKMGWCNPCNMKYGAAPSLKLANPSCDGRVYVKGFSSDGKMCPTGREGAAPDAGQRYDEHVVATYYRSGTRFPPVVV